MEHTISLFLACTVVGVYAQQDTTLLAHDQHTINSEYFEDNTAAVNEYEPLNIALGGDSIRLCNSYACTGWVEDHYPEGALKHRGYYNDGHLVIYKNYYPDGSLEREFRSVDNFRCLMRTFHTNGLIRSEAKYYQGRAIEYTDHYPNGQVRYKEEKHRSQPYYLRMDLYAVDGKPISLLQLVDGRKMQFEQREYHPTGQLKEMGRAQYDPIRMDTRRIGTWISYDRTGRAVREDDYVDGKVHSSRDL